MASGTSRLRVILEMVTGQYVSGARTAATETGKLADSTEHASKRMQGFDKAVKATLGAASLGAVVRFANESAQSFSKLNESMNAVRTIFGDASDQIFAFSATAAQSAGLAKSEFQEMATVLGAALGNAGMSADETAEKTIALTQRAADMASVFNTDVSGALGAIQAALRGESDPIEKFGVTLSAAKVEAEAAVLGFQKVGGEFDATAKTAARLSLIMKQTEKVSGDFADTAEDAANKTRQLNAELENQKAAFGESTVGIKLYVTKFATEFVSLAAKAAKSFQGIGAGAIETSDQLRRLARDGVDLVANRMAAMTAAVIVAGDEMFIGSMNTAESTKFFADAIKTLQTELGATPAEIAKVAANVREFGTEMGLNRWQVEGFAAAAADAIDKGYDLGRSQDEAARASRRGKGGAAAYREGLEDVKEEGEETIPVIQQIGEAAKKSADKVRDAGGALQMLADKLRAQADPVFAAVDALGTLRDTYAEIDEDSKRTAEETLELADALLATESALRGLGGGKLEEGIESIALALKWPREEVEELLRQLGLLDGMTVTTVIDLQVPRLVGSPGAAKTTEDLIRRLSGLAEGGPVAAGQPYLVGEKGPELFVSNTSGRIIPNNMLGQGGGGNVSITVVSPTTQNLDRDLAYASLMAGLMTQVGA